jgi:hypothetical protein
LKFTDTKIIIVFVLGDQIMIPVLKGRRAFNPIRPFSLNKNGPFPKGPFNPIISAVLSNYSENLPHFTV